MSNYFTIRSVVQGGKDMYDYKKIIPFGYYKKNPVYYDLNEGSLKVS